MTYLDFNALDRMPLEREPYDYLIVENFILPKQFGDVSRDFPNVPGPGSHPPAELNIDGQFAGLMDELQGPAFKEAIERKFDIDAYVRWTETL